MGNVAEAASQALALPTGGGAIRGIGETFQADPFTGAGSFVVPIWTPTGREGFGPQLTLQYSAGHGNGPFGLGWRLSVPRITRKTAKGLPRYEDDDVFVLSGADDLVVQRRPGTAVADEAPRGRYTVRRYRPRTEGLFARIERWHDTVTDELHWRITTRNNVTSIYGRSGQARIADPRAESERAAGLTQRSRVFEWLLEETFDTKGNHILYEYAADDPELRLEGPEAEHRTYCQRYLRRICYGTINGVPTYPGGTPVGVEREMPSPADPSVRLRRRYVFEVVFDYGGDTGRSQPGLSAPEWFGGPSPPIREDVFSSHRAGFEIRTLRRCERVLVYHHFGELGEPTLVRSTDFAYGEDAETRISFLTAVGTTGYRRDGTGLRTAEAPALTFRYTEFRPHEQRYRSLRAVGDDMPPASLGDPGYALVDVFGEGLPGVLEARGEGFRYWRNLGDGLLDRPRVLPTMPAGLALGQPGVGFADVDGDGRAELLVHAGSLQGFFRATPDGAWETFKPYPDLPSFDPTDPNVRLVDLTGDGRSDALMTRDHHFLWFECLGDEGFAAPRPVERVHDLDAFPDVHFDDPSRRLHLADMDGDGLADIVLLHQGRVDYWPNLGYGRFGPRLTMRAVPDPPQLDPVFDPRRLFLADLDGTGCADLVYVDFDRVHFWFNRSGNSWSPRHTIHGTPTVDDAASVRLADVFGSGTATLLWTSAFASQPQGNYKALDFAGGVKPYLLQAMDNHMGATTRVRYAPSTRFALTDARAGRAWVTRPPFPVHVVERVEVLDHVGQTKLVTAYAYGHGYFDGREREFRGFARVDVTDTEDFEAFREPGLHAPTAPFANAAMAHHAAPSVRRTWFHTGASFEDPAVRARLRSEFWGGDPAAFDLDPLRAVPPDSARALHGRPIRVEVYGLDGSPRESVPLSVAEHGYDVRVVQPAAAADPPVHFVFCSDAVVHQYERDPADPRVTHELTLRVDDHGNTTDAVSVAYPRRRPAAALPEQAARHVLYTKTDFINHTAGTDFHYAGVPCQSRTFEVLGLQSADASGVVRSTDLGAVVGDLSVPLALGSFLPFEADPSLTSGPAKRILAWNRRYFRRDDAALSLDIDATGTPRRTLVGRLPLGEIGSLGLPYENYDAALTTSLVDDVFGAGSTGPPLLTGAAVPGLLADGGYHQEPDVAGVWWVPSGQHRFDPAQFYRPVLTADPHGVLTTIVLDRYALLAEEVRDALGNVVAARARDARGRIEPANDYRVLAPRALMDANGTISEVAFDALGRVAARAVRKGAEGDALHDVDPDPPAAEVDAYLEDPLGRGAGLLGSATVRTLFRPEYRGDPPSPAPPVVMTISRDRHTSDSGGPSLPLHHRLEYFDGFGRGVQTKFVAEPGPIVAGGPAQSRRWVGSGWTIFDNKARPVRKHEPFFSATHRFERDRAAGLSVILLYDSLGRVVATLYPNHTYQKALTGPWARTHWDANDTVDPSRRFDPSDPGAVPPAGFDPSQDPDVGPFFARLPTSAYRDTWHARRTDPAKLLTVWPDVDPAGRPIAENAHVRAAEEAAARATARHAATPTVTHLDPLGRAFLTVTDAGWGDDGAIRLLALRTALDPRGAERTVTDARGLTVFTYVYDLLGRLLATDSRDAGLRRSLPDVHGEPIVTWDAAGTAVFHRYDAARRLTEIWTRAAAASDFELRERTVYGEAHSGDPQATNHRGRVWKVFDGAGVLEHVGYDFKGNPLETVRVLLADSRSQVTWAVTPDPPSHAFDATRAETLLAAEHTYRMRSAYDALNRVVRHETPDGSTQEFAYNTANLLAALRVRSPGASAAHEIIRAVEYNAQGQRVRVDFGNDVATEYSYDPETSRLERLRTARLGGSATAPLQDLRYTYDPVGNVTHVRDDAHAAVFSGNLQIDPVCRYTYDAAYRLTAATGREHQAMTACHHERHDDRHTVFCQLPQSAANAQALGNYAETYRYDAGGNLEEIRHRVNGQVRWVRTQRYAGNSNRLESSDAGCADEQLALSHDAGGNLTALPHLPGLRWDFKSRLVGADLNRGANPNRAHYQYDAAGNRVRKTVVKNGGLLIEERIYVGLFELFLRRTSAGVTDRQHVIHVRDDQHRVALLLEELTPAGPRRVLESQLRYQLGDHLGSAHVEVDGGSDARILSYEEHRPYGGSAYIAGEGEGQARRKRHRYTGQECDEESGLYYFGARYYAPWLARWLSPDPAGPRDGPNLYQAFRGNPIVYVDRDGRQADDEIDTNQLRREVKQHKRAREAQEQISKAEEAIDEARSAARRLTESAETVRNHVLAQSGALKDEEFDQEELKRMQKDTQAKGKELEDALKRAEREMKKAEKLAKKLPEAEVLVDTARAAQARNLQQEIAEARKRAKDIQRETGELVRQAVEQKGRGGRPPGGPHGGPGDPPVKAPKGRWGEFGKAMLELVVKKGGKVVPIVGTGIGVAAVASELSEGNYARAFVEAAGASEIPIVAQVADVGGLTADAAWIVKDHLLDPEGKLEQWYYERFD